MTTEQHFQELVTGTEGATLGQLFGKACGKLNGKAFVAFFRGDMVFKIGREEVQPCLAKYEGAQNWDPSGKGRPMKDWLQVPAIYQSDWEVLTQKAIQFMAG